MVGVPGSVVWFVGLSGSGKSTLSAAVETVLLDAGKSVQTLDGDDLRKGLCSDLGFSVTDRIENVRRAMCLAQLLSRGGSVVLVSLITPFHSMQEMVRQQIPNMIQVFVNAPLSICEERDTKGLYAKARAGNLSYFTGVDSAFEWPVSPEVVCRTDIETVDQSLHKIIACLQQNHVY